MGHVHAAAPEGRVVAGDVVAATGSGKTDIVTMTLAALFTAVRGSRVCVVLIETLEGAGKLLATLARLDANMYFLNSSKTGGGDYKDDRVNKINVSCDSKSGWVTRDKKTTEAIEQLQRMATGDRPSVIVCLYQSARILLQLQCLSGVVFCARIMDEVHTVARSVGWSACHFLSTSHLILGLTATAVPSQCRGRSVLAIDEADCIEMNIAKSTDELRELPVASVASVATQVGVVKGGGLPIQRDEQYKALLGYMAKRFSTIGSWMNGPCCFRPAPNFNRKEWTGRVLEQGDKYLWQAGDDIWVPVPKYDKDEVASEQRGQDVYELQIQVEPVDNPEAGAELTDNGRVAALVKDASGRGMRWIVGEMQSMRDWINTNLCSDEKDGPVKSDFGTYLTREAPHFGDMPFQRPVLFALSKQQSDELDYTVPPVIDVPYMDRSALQDQRLKDKLDAVEESGKVTLPTGTKVSAEDFYNAQALRKRFERGDFNTYPRYHGLPSHHILVQCSTSCAQVDMVHDLLSHALGGFEVDGESIVVEKAHSKINGGDGGMTKELRNKKALDNFKNGRFGVLVVCEMFVQGADFPELDEVFPWNSNLDNEMANVQLGGRASRKVEGGSKERYGVQLGIQYLEEEDDDDGDDDGMDNDNGAPTPESFFACLTKDGVQLYTQLAAAFGENVKFRVRYTRKKKKKKDVTEEEGEADDMEVDDGGFVSTTFTEMDIAAIRALVGVDRFDGEPFSSKLEKWKAELEKGGEWVRSPNGTRPKGVINQRASSTHRPYQRKVSTKVDTLLGNRMTKHGWDHYEKMNGHDLCVFHAFVSRELG
ncbi:MAG: helicase C-terminal domain-containing protein, partial [bacterium]